MIDPALAVAERCRGAREAHGVAALAADKRKPSRSERAALDAANRKLTAAEYELAVVVPTTKDGNRAKLDQLAYLGDPELVRDAIASILRSPFWL
jgi:hypothetical protein